MFSIKNSQLSISVHPTGAELHKITAIKTNLEFLWNGDSRVWSGRAPNLFPIVGTLKDGFFIYDNQSYALPRHGFARHSDDFVLTDKGNDFLIFTLRDSTETLESYPFKFEFSITYTLRDNALTVTYKVQNTDDKTLYFSVGGHPAFKCPVYPHEAYSDYILRFDQVETSQTHLLNINTGLFTGQVKAVLSTPQTLALHPHLFDDDALVFKDLKSKKITLESKNHGAILDFIFNDFPFLGIWAKPNAHFVCLEPWQGLADSENSDQQIVTKEGIVALNEKQFYTASYTIEINERHLS